MIAAPLGPDHPAVALVADWRRHLELGRGRSAHTVRAYAAGAMRLIGFLAVHRGEAIDAAAVAGASLAELRAFLAHRRGEGLSNASAARELSAVRGFVAFAGGQAPAALRGPRVKRGVPRPVSPRQAIGIADDAELAAEEPWIGARDRAVLLLLYGAGLRIAEALSLTADALPLGPTIRVTGKRNKTRVVPLLAPVRAAIEAYVADCPYPPEKGTALFRGAKGGPLSPGMIRRAVQAARGRLDLDARATPHALRHSFASHLLGRGADLRQLQELLGHASLSSTQVYAAVDAAHLLDVYRHAHPRGGG